MRQYLVQNRIIDSRYSPNGVLIAIALKIANYLKINVLKNLNGIDMLMVAQLLKRMMVDGSMYLILKKDIEKEVLEP